MKRCCGPYRRIGVGLPASILAAPGEQVGPLSSFKHDRIADVTTRRLLRWLGVALAALVMLGAGLWGALAIWVRLAPPTPLREILSGGLLLLALAAIVCMVLRRWPVVLLYGACISTLLAWYATLQPSNDRAWAADVARISSGDVDGDRLVVRNVRNFQWRSDTDFDQRWETRSYDLSALTGVDLVMSYWAGEAIAHAMLSFGFADGRHLAFSIETRKEQGQSYSAIAGFFRSYGLSVIAADERDVIGVRTNVRGEDVRIYRLRMPPPVARRLLLEYIAQANDLAKSPEFYNSLTTNCTTEIFRMVVGLEPGLPLDYRILLSGYVPDYVYDHGGLDTRLPFMTIRERSHIKGRAESTDPDFSRKIRNGVPVPQ
jgi:hypothetical protein